jgi:hypothetical protein
MYTAKPCEVYAGEPLPLKRGYPDDEQGDADFLMRVAGLMYGVLALFLVVSLSIGTESLHRLFLLLIPIIFLSGVSLVIYASKIGAWQKRYEWKKAFQVNNADLEIDYKAVRVVISHMKEHTRYLRLDFQEVVVHLACALRQEEIYINFRKEIFENYQFFTGKRADCPRTYCPK